MKRLRMLILVNWKEDGEWPLLHSLAGRVRRAAVLQPVSFKGRVSGRIAYASHYLSEFYTPVMALARRKDADVVVSWQMRIGVCYGILKRIFHAGRPPIHVIQDFHIDLTRTDRRYRIQIGLMKLALAGIDYFLCTSTEEEAIYSRMFSIPRDRIAFLPLVESPKTFDEKPCPREDYVFSYGKSDRDFDTLIRAAAVLGLRVQILSQRYRPAVPVPENVSIIRSYIPGKEMIRRISAARVVVVPLKDYRISAGQISMLEVMALGRPLVVTANMATKEYAVDGQEALFYRAGDERELADRIRDFWERPEEAERIGRQARSAALAMHDRRMAVFDRLLARFAADLQKGERR